MKNLQNKPIDKRLIVSIVDGNGIKQFSVHYLIKKILLYAVLVIAISVISIFFIIKLFAAELEEIRVHKDETLEKYSNLYNKNQVLKQQIDISQEKLDEINRTILDLEDVVNMRNGRLEAESVKFDILTLNDSQKETLLRLLPNGLPLEPLADEDSALDIQTTKLKYGIVFDTSARTPIIATADGIVDLTRNEYTEEDNIGKFVKVVHSFGFSSIYGYLSDIRLKRGDIVRKGQIIGYSGGKGDKAYYDIRFLGSEVNIDNLIKWNLKQFELVMNQDSIINWDGLLWTFDDMMKINNHKIFVQHENTLSMK